jgi:hypothetical protein
MAARIRDVLDRQAEELERLERNEARHLLKATEQAARELADELDRLEQVGGGESFTAQHLRVMLAQTDAAIAKMRQTAGQALRGQMAAVYAIGAQHAIQIIASQEPHLVEAGGVMEVAVMRRLDELNGLQIHRFALERYGADVADRIQRELVAGYAKGNTYRQLRRRLLDAEDGPLVPTVSRAQLVVRMESNAAYNRANQAALEEVAAETDWDGTGDPLMKQADETRDRRNHPISRAVDGMISPLDEPFRVSVAKVEAALAELNAQRSRTKSGKARKPMRLSGVTMRREGGDFVGNYPFHMGERGRQVPYRRSWWER